MRLLVNELDRTAAEADSRYTLLTNAMSNESLQGMVGHRALSAAQGRRVKKELINMARLMLESEETRIEVEMEGLTESARNAAHEHLSIDDAKNDSNALRDALRASEEASTSYLLGEVTSQVNRDVNQTIKNYRNASLRAMMKTSLSGISRDQANQDVLIEEMNAGRKLFYTDSKGRRIKSNLHIRRVWRQATRDHWVQVYLHILASYGISEAVMWHPDVTHRYYGAPILISEPDYGLEDRHRALHPNSRAIPVAPQYMEMTV